MSEFIQGFQTTEGEKKYDYNALGNLPDLTISKEDVTGALGFVPPSKAEVEASVKIASNAAATADNKAVAAQTTANQAVGVAQQAQSTADGAVLAAQNAQNRADDAHERIDDSYSQIVQGSVITIDDCDNAPLQNLRIFGKTTQDTTTGKNLFGCKDVEFKGAATTTNCTAGVITRTATAAIDSTYLVDNGALTMLTSTLPAGTYVFQLHDLKYTTAVKPSGVYLEIEHDDGSITQIPNGKATTLTSAGSIKNIRCSTLAMQANQYVSYKCQLELGSTATEYEPYTGGIPSPNPDYPQPLESVGDGGSVTVRVCGKNLLDVSQFTNGSQLTITNGAITITTSNDSIAVNTGKKLAELAPSLEVGKNYILTFKTTSTNNMILLYHTNTYWNSNSALSITQEHLDSTVFLYASGKSTTATITDMMIRFASAIDASYEPYKEIQTLTISTPNGLPGIPVTSGGNYTDENGQQWICDEVDFERGMYVQKVNIHTFTGTETIPSLSLLTNTVRFSIELSKKSVGYAFKAHEGLFSHGDYSQEWSSDVVHAYTNDLIGVFFLPKSYGTTKSEIQAWITAQYENGTPVKVCYMLAEENSIPLTTEEIATYSALHTVYPNTTVFNDVGAGMEVKYATPSTVLTLSGGRMNGSIDMVNHQLTGLPTPKNNTDAVSLEYLQETKLELAKGINDVSDIAYGAQETADEALEEAVDAHERIDDSQVQVVKGEVVSVGNSADAPLQGLRIFGKTEQKTTTGKNLFDVNSTTTQSIDASGTLSTATSGRLTDFIPVTGQYLTISGKLLEGITAVTSQYRIICYDADKNFVERILCGTKTIVTKDVSSYTYIRLNFFASEFDETTVQMEWGNRATAYEPYTGGIPSPNPDYPQELESVGESVNVIVCGKNLLKPTGNASAISNGITYTKNADGSVSVSGTASSTAYYMYRENFPAGTYIVSGAPSGSKIGELDIYVNAKDIETGADIKASIARDADDAKHLQQFTIEQYCRLECMMRVGSGKTVDAIFYPMIRPASITDDTFEPYNAQTLTFSTPNGLPGIPVASGGNYTDENGQQWLCDEVDFEKGVYVQRVGIKTLNGSENWSEGTCITSGISRYVILDDKTADKNIIKRCSHFKSVLRSAYVALEDGLYYGTEAFIFDFAISTDKIADVSSWKNWLNSNPVEVHWQLAEPIETALSAEELAQYAVLHTNYSNTTIFNDAGADMEVKYATPTTALPLTGGRYKVATPYAPTDAVPKSYADRIDKKVDTLREVVSSFHSNIVQEASGEMIQVYGSAEAPLAGLKMFGKTEQFTTTGKNLLQNKATTQTKNGVTFTVNDDGTVTVNGTSTVTNSSFTYGLNTIILPVGEYILSGTPSGFITTARFTHTDGHYSYREDAGNGVTLSIAEDIQEIWVYIDTKANVSYVNAIFHPMIRLASITDDTYEPYTGGVPSPNPDYPQALESVGDDGSLTTMVCGKNLLEPRVYDPGVSNTGLTMVYNQEDGSVRITGTAIGNVNVGMRLAKPLYTGETAYVYFEGVGSVRFAGRDADGNNAYGNMNLTSPGMLQVMPINGDYMEAIAVTTRFTTGTVVDVTAKFMVTTEQTDYEAPKTAQTMAISTPNGLPGIPVTSGGNYIDENGQQWLCDEVNFEKGTYVQRIQKRTVENARTKTWGKLSNGVPYIELYNPVDKYNGNTTGGLSNAYPWSSTTTNGVFRTFIDTVLVCDERFTDLDTGVALLTELGFEALIGLRESIETALSEEELTTYAALHTNYPNTAIFNDDGAHMEVKYIADTKMYIDKKFEELAEILVNKL